MLSRCCWVLGGNAERKGCAWAALDCLSTQEVALTSALQSSSCCKGPSQRGNGQESVRPSGRGNGRKSGQGRGRGETKNPGTLIHKTAQRICLEHAQSQPVQNTGQLTGPLQNRTKKLSLFSFIYLTVKSPFSPGPLSTPVFVFVSDDSVREFDITDGKCKRYKLTDAEKFPKSLLLERVCIILLLWRL